MQKVEIGDSTCARGKLVPFDNLNKISGIRSCESHYVFLAIKGVRHEVSLTTTQSQDGYTSKSWFDSTKGLLLKTTLGEVDLGRSSKVNDWSRLDTIPWMTHSHGKYP